MASCVYCKDSGAVDKEGNIAPDNRYALAACPMCNKDSTPKLDIEKALTEIAQSRKSMRWALALDRNRYQEVTVLDIEAYVKSYLVSKKGNVPCQYVGKTKDGDYKIVFHPSLYFNTLKFLLDRLDPGSFTVERESVPEAKKNERR